MSERLIVLIIMAAILITATIAPAYADYKSKGCENAHSFSGSATDKSFKPNKKDHPGVEL